MEDWEENLWQGDLVKIWAAIGAIGIGVWGFFLGGIGGAIVGAAVGAIVGALGIPLLLFLGIRLAGFVAAWAIIIGVIAIIIRLWGVGRP